MNTNCKEKEHSINIPLDCDTRVGAVSIASNELKGYLNLLGKVDKDSKEFKEYLKKAKDMQSRLLSMEISLKIALKK